MPEPEDDYSERLTYLSRAYPPTSRAPGLISSVARSSRPSSRSRRRSTHDPEDLLAATSSMKQGAELLDQMRALDERKQKAVYEHLTADERKLLTLMKFRPPWLKENKKGFFGKAAAALDWGKQMLNRGIRTLYDVAAEDDTDFSIDGLSRAWRRTKDGERYLDDPASRLRQFKVFLPEEYWDAAIAYTQESGNLEYVIGKYGPEVEAYFRSHPEELREADEILDQTSRVSLGRLLSGGAGRLNVLGSLNRYIGSDADKRSQLRSDMKKASGLWDAIGSFLDPLIVGGKVSKAFRARTIMSDLTDLSRVTKFGPIRRNMTDTVSLINSSDDAAKGVTKAMTVHPSLVHVSEDLVRHVKSARSTKDGFDLDSFSQFFADGITVENLTAGKAITRSANLDELVAAAEGLRGITFGGLRGKGKLTGRKAIDFFAELKPINVPATKFDLNVFRRSGQLLRGISNLYARSPDGFRPLGPGSFNHFSQIAKIALPSHKADEFIADYINGATLGEKYRLYRTMMDQTYTSLGSTYRAGMKADELDELATIHKSFLGHIDDDFKGSMFSVADTKGSVFTDPATNESLSVAIRPHQTKIRWAAPDLEAIAQAQFAMTRLGHIQKWKGMAWTKGKGAGFMKFWRHSVVAKASFGFRNGTEEATQYILRNGLHPWLDARGKISSTKRAVKRGTLDPNSALGSISALYLPAAARAGDVTPEGVQAAILFGLKHHGPGILPPDVSAMGRFNADTAQAAANHVRAGTKVKKVRLVQDGTKMKEVRDVRTGNRTQLTNADDPRVIPQWQTEIISETKNEDFWIYLDNITEDRDTIAKSIADYYRDNPDVRDQFALYTYFDDLEEALATHADRVVSHLDALLTSTVTNKKGVAKKVPHHFVKGWVEQAGGISPADAAKLKVLSSEVRRNKAKMASLPSASAGAFPSPSSLPRMMDPRELVGDLNFELYNPGKSWEEVVRAKAGTSGVSLERLKADIAANGVKKPIQVAYDSESGRYFVIDGNHRLLAAQDLGIKKIPVNWEDHTGRIKEGGRFEEIADRLPVVPRDRVRSSAADPAIPILKAANRNLKAQARAVKAKYGFKPDPESDLYTKFIPTETDLALVPSSARPPVLTVAETLETIGDPKHLQPFIRLFEISDTHINWLARQEIGVLETARGLQFYKPAADKLLASGMAPELVDDLYSGWVNARMIREASKQIDTPLFRSVYQQAHPHLMPFLHAQQQFIKRWGHLALTDPAAFRKPQLLMNGIREMGFTSKDDQGNDRFNYPAVGILQKLFAPALSTFYGNPSAIPATLPFSGKVKYLIPGLNDPFMPSFGPFVSSSFAAARTWLPEFAPELASPIAKAEKEVVGEFAGGRSIWENWFPSWAASIVKGILAPVDEEPALLSAQHQAIALGLHNDWPGLRESATPQEQHAAIEDIKTWSRAILVLRGIFGLFAPASPSIDKFSNLHPEFVKLLQGLPIEEALAVFLARNPKAQSYTIFSSASDIAGQKGIGTDAVIGEWINANPDFVKRHGPTASWFLPEPPPSSGFDSNTYRAELAMNWRKRRTADEFWEAAVAQSSSGFYYRQRDKHRDALARTRAPRAKARLRQTWSEWSEAYKTAHPIFALHQREGSTRVLEREHAIKAAANAISDPDVPSSPSVFALNQLITGYQAYKTQLSRLSGQSDARSTRHRRSIHVRFINWAGGIDDPNAFRFFNQLIRPDLPPDILAMLEGEV